MRRERGSPGRGGRAGRPSPGAAQHARMRAVRRTSGRARSARIRDRARGVEVILDAPRRLAGRVAVPEQVRGDHPVSPSEAGGERLEVPAAARDAVEARDARARLRRPRRGRAAAGRRRSPARSHGVAARCAGRRGHAARLRPRAGLGGRPAGRPGAGDGRGARRSSVATLPRGRRPAGREISLGPRPKGARDPWSHRSVEHVTNGCRHRAVCVTCTPTACGLGAWRVARRRVAVIRPREASRATRAPSRSGACSCP